MMNKITFLLLTLGILLIVDPLHAGEWNEKPVMCEQKEIFEKIMVERGELLFSKGDSLATVRDPDGPNGYSKIPAVLPVRLYYNPQEKTFTFAEYHASINSVCIIAFGHSFSMIGISS